MNKMLATSSLLIVLFCSLIDGLAIKNVQSEQLVEEDAAKIVTASFLPAIQSEIGSLLTATSTSQSPESRGDPTTKSNLIEHIYTVSERETISLKCPIEMDKLKSSQDSVYDESEKRVINWYKDSAKITEGDPLYSPRYILSDGTYLKIRHVSLRDTGKLKCTVVDATSNKILAESNIINLIVQPAVATNSAQTGTRKNENVATGKKMSRKHDATPSGPSFLNSVVMQPPVFYKQRGESVKLKCRATGSPRPNIIWYKNGDILNQEDFSGFTRSKWMLELNELRLDDGGNFTCHVFNKFGYINKTFEVVVNEDDSQIFEGLDPLNTTILAGMDAVFSCKVKSNAVPNIKWMKQISKSEYSKYVVQPTESPNSVEENILLEAKPIKSELPVYQNDINAGLSSSDSVLNSYYAQGSEEFKQPTLANKKDREEFLLNDVSGGNSDPLNLDSASSQFSDDLEFDKLFDNKKSKRDLEQADSMHYITLTSSPMVEQKMIYNKEKKYYINQLTIKQASVKDSGIYVCFGANSKGYNYRKAYLKVVPNPATTSSSTSKTDIKFEMPAVERPKLVRIKPNKFETTSTYSIPRSNGFNNQIQSITSLLIILVPVILITIFAFISICYLKHGDKSHEKKNCSLINLIKPLLCKCSRKGAKKSRKDLEEPDYYLCCCIPVTEPKYNEKSDYLLNHNNQVVGMGSNYHYTGRRQLTKSTLTTSQTSGTNTTCCGDTSLIQANCGSLGAKSDSTQGTTVAYYLTVPVNSNYTNTLIPANLAIMAANGINTNNSILSSSTISTDANNCSPPPLPASQPPTMSPIKKGDQDEENDMPGTLNRAESTASMAYYKIVDGDFNNGSRFYYQLATVPQFICAMQQQQQQQQHMQHNDQ